MTSCASPAACAQDVEHEWVTLSSTDNCDLFKPTHTKEAFVAHVKRMWFTDWKIHYRNLRLMKDRKVLGRCMLFANLCDGISVGRTGRKLEFDPEMTHFMVNNITFDESGKIKSWYVFDQGSEEDIARIRQLFVGLLI